MRILFSIIIHIVVVSNELTSMDWGDGCDEDVVTSILDMIVIIIVEMSASV